uniref:sulfotransferase family protein n=1 Tax=Marinobacterium profundum TaxID=1714300 RepID=UPI000B01A60A|nr:sulfotransferase [Marinobacterium profundum]
MRKVFLYSLPRSGSTLFQKYLARNKDTYTISEPWIALPIVYIFKEEKVFSEYEHHLFYRSYADLKDQNIDTNSLRINICKSAIDTYYKTICPESAKVFIDKTPRYSIICKELLEMYPEDIHVVLFRHPFACINSMINTFGNGNWCMYRFDIDLFMGASNLADMTKEKNKNVIAFRYEDFINNPEFYYLKLCESLDLSPDNKSEFSSVKLNGSLGDPTGDRKYGGSIGGQNEEGKWVDSFNTLYRRRWAKIFLIKFGYTNFESLGYSIKDTQENICKSKYSLSQELKDIPHIILGFLHRHTGIYVTYVRFKNKRRKVANYGVR